MSAGEVVMRLPGVAGNPTDEGLAYRFNMRGMDATLNNVTIDGATLPSLGQNRSFEMQSITGTMFDALELIKGHTPDKDASSLGGTVNFKSRATFMMREDSRTTYNFSTRWAPPFFEETPIRAQHRAHPILNVTHQQVFSVFGEHRNLGVSLNAFYSENAVGGAYNYFDYINQLDPKGAAPVWDYRTWDNTNNRKQLSLNLKADYRLGRDAKISLSLTGNDNYERMRRRVTVRAFTGSATTALSNTSGIVPGASDQYITVVRPGIAANDIDVTMDGPLNYYTRTRRLDMNGDWTLLNGALYLEYGANVGYNHLNNGNGRGGTLNMRIGQANPTTGVFTFGGAGWILDRTQDQEHPLFKPNGGPDFTDPKNYRPRPTDGLVQQRNENDQLIRQARFDAKYKIPFLTAPTNFKTGFSWKDLRQDQSGKDRHRWSYIPNGPALPNDPTYVSYDMIETGRAIPFWQAHMFTTDGRPKDPSLWVEDLYEDTRQRFISTNGVKEQTAAYYLMAQGRLAKEGFFARAGYLGGVRFEDNKDVAWGWVRGRTLSTAAQQAQDPVGWAIRDYAPNYRVTEGKYAKSFPSIHSYYDITNDLKVRVSYSTSYGRPPLANLVPGETPTEATQTVTVNNPGLKPYTAQSWDTALEYYFEPVGALTFSWFHKDIKGFILTQDIGTIPQGTDNGYNGEYAGWVERTQVNGSNAIVQGWEFAYQQQFTWLPGLWKTLSASFNYTWLDTHGNRDGTRYLGRRDVVGPSGFGFIPMAYNASLSWRFKKFNTRVLYNYTGENVTTFNPTNPAQSVFRLPQERVDIGLGYQLRPALGLSLDVSNIFNTPQSSYMGYKDRMRQNIYNFVTIAVGVRGQF
jgi:TonB-dependent receptor